MGASAYDLSILKQKGEKLYSDLSNLDPSQEMSNSVNNSLSEKIQLIVSIKNIKNGCSYQIKLFDINNNQHIPLNKIFECKTQDNKTTYLNTHILIRYFFEREQPLLVEIYRKDSEIEKKDIVKTTLGNIMGSIKMSLEKKISPSEDEMLVLKAEKLNKKKDGNQDEEEEVINFRFDIVPKDESKKIDFSDIKYKMYYEIYSDNRILYRSECSIDKGKKGSFNPVKIPKNFFQNKHVKVIFYKSSRKERGRMDYDFSDFINIKSISTRVNGTQFNLISSSFVTKNYTFVDYLNVGLKIGLSVAIDFTGSNGNPNESKSLHYIGGMEPNQYERAIYSCGNIISPYNYEQSFPCFGFGAKINNMPYQIFNLNFQQDPNVIGIQGIIDEYHNALRNVQLWGPTYFCPIIRTINEMIIKDNNQLKYQILMILTDGMIDDIDETIKELVKGSFLPLSVIIIGVGREDFSSMIQLDADENPLIDCQGKMAGRDLVQFVPFLKYELDPRKLANEVLAEIPKQILEYYELKNLSPSSLNANNLTV